MTTPVGPAGPPPDSTNPQDSDQGGGDFPQPFAGMSFTKKQYQQFLKTEFKFLSQIVKHDMEQMKKAMRKLRHASE